VAAALRGRATQRGRAAGGAPGVSSGRHSGGVGGWRTVLRGRGRRAALGGGGNGGGGLESERERGNEPRGMTAGP
jgi:hypothetical protein